MRKNIIYKVSRISILVNILLSVIKVIMGIVSNSNALISDAVHSLSDVISTFVVIIGTKLASKDDDNEHNYGHDRFECVASIILSMMLSFVALILIINSISKLNNNIFIVIFIYFLKIFLMELKMLIKIFLIDSKIFSKKFFFSLEEDLFLLPILISIVIINVSSTTLINSQSI